MVPPRARGTIKAWQHGDLLLESYYYPPGPPGAMLRHIHETYQIGLSLDFPGEYVYRGAHVAVPARSLSVIHPGEPHAARDPHARTEPARFRMLYVPPAKLREVAVEIAGRPQQGPFVAQSVILDHDLITQLLRAHVALEAPAPRLAQETLLLAALSTLLVRYTHTRLMPQPPSARPEVRRARDYLHAHLADNVSLTDLARVAGLSPYEFCRVFGATYGLPPHRYHLYARIDHARELLVRGLSPAAAAVATGFSDQSHFGRHFKQLIGVTPGAYASKRKNILDNGRHDPLS
jgi:AraC-like DNA-binding protein